MPSLPAPAAAYHDWHRRVRVTEAASAVAFWVALALAPASIVAVNVLGLVMDQREVADHLAVLARAAPGSFGDLVLRQLTRVAEPTPGTWGRDAILVVVSLWTISTAFAMLLRGLQRGFGRPPASFGLARVLGGAVGFVAVIVVGAVAFALDAQTWLVRVLGYVLAAIVVWLLVFGLYRLAFGRATPREAKALAVAAAAAAVALVLIQAGWENLAQASAGLALTQGPLAGIVISLVGLWLAAFVILLGPFVAAQVTDTALA